MKKWTSKWLSGGTALAVVAGMASFGGMPAPAQAAKETAGGANEKLKLGGAKEKAGGTKEAGGSASGVAAAVPVEWRQHAIAVHIARMKDHHSILSHSIARSTSKRAPGTVCTWSKTEAELLNRLEAKILGLIRKRQLLVFLTTVRSSGVRPTRNLFCFPAPARRSGGLYL